MLTSELEAIKIYFLNQDNETTLTDKKTLEQLRDPENQKIFTQDQNRVSMEPGEPEWPQNTWDPNSDETIQFIKEHSPGLPECPNPISPIFANKMSIYGNFMLVQNCHNPNEKPYIEVLITELDDRSAIWFGEQCVWGQSTVNQAIVGDPSPRCGELLVEA